jgi:uncharacterized RDD family membrane protein YckC
MAKQRFRDVKQGRIQTPEKGKKRMKSQSLPKRPATLGERFKAFLTDSFMILMPIMYLVFYLVFHGREGFAEHKLFGWLLILIPYILISALLIARSGRTPGMRAYEIRVVMCGSGESPSFGVALLRQILAVWDFFLFTWIAQFFLRDHRTPHEILSGTCLIHDPFPPKAAR